MLFILRVIILPVFLLFQIGCDSNDKKVYKKFDTSE